MNKSRIAAFAEESAEVEVLFAEAAKFDNISKRIRASLGRLDGGAQVVKDSIGPVHDNTKNLQTMNDSKITDSYQDVYIELSLDIDKMLVAIDKMLLPGEDKGREERIIRAGYVHYRSINHHLEKSDLYRPGKVGLADYLSSLNRINRALSQLSESNLRINQQSIGDFNELLSIGGDNLKSLFRSLLSSNTQSVEPLHYITKRRS